MTPLSERINTYHDAWLSMHLAHGRLYMEEGEYYSLLAKRLARYAIFLAKAAVRAKYRDPRFRKHHRAAVGRVIRSLTAGAAPAPGRRRSRAPDSAQ